MSKRKRVKLDFHITWEPLANLVKNAPSVAGIYFLGAPYPIAYERGVSQIFYIGSAKNLRKRLQSHFRERERGSLLIRTMLAQGEEAMAASFPVEGLNEDALFGVEYAVLYNFGRLYGMIPHGNRYPPDSNQTDRWLERVTFQDAVMVGTPLKPEMIAERYGLLFEIGPGPFLPSLTLDFGEEIIISAEDEDIKSVEFMEKL